MTPRSRFVLILLAAGSVVFMSALPKIASAQGLLGKRYGKTAPSKKSSKKPAPKPRDKKPTPKPVGTKPKFDDVMARLWKDIEADSSGPAGEAVQRAAKELTHAVGLRAGSVEVE